MLTLIVGERSCKGKISGLMQAKSEATPLQRRLATLSERVAIAGIIISCLLATILFIRLWYRASSENLSRAKILEGILFVVVEALALVVVAVPEGLPLAVTLVLAYSTKRMLKDSNLVRNMASCETMGNVNVICTDKTGTLTTNKMTVVNGCLYTEPLSNPKEDLKILSDAASQLLAFSIAANTTAFAMTDPSTRLKKYIGNSTEIALLRMIDDLGINAKEIRESTSPFQVFPFSSATKAMSTIIYSTSNSLVQYSKGAPEVILEGCKYFVDRSQNVSKLTHEVRLLYQQKLEEMSKQALRTIAMAYKWHKSIPEQQVPADMVLTDMTLIGVFGIEDPLRGEVLDSVRKCKKAGVRVAMVTGDHPETACAIARKCEILTDQGMMLLGSEFRRLSEEELNKVAPSIQVLARSTPVDKQVLVQKLKDLGNIVAATGDGTNDGPALRSADVSFSMGVCGTSIAKEASSIILLDDNFASIVKAITWGRCINDSIRKFLQFMLVVNISAALISIVTASFSTRSRPIFNPIQLLWINIIMDTFGALALATDKPNDSLLNRKPERATDSLVTSDMCCMIAVQAILQLAIIFSEYFGGVSAATIFNTFIFLQLFNLLNCRSVHSEQKNIFRGIASNWLFLGILFADVVVQCALMLYATSVVTTDQKISLADWIMSISLAALALPAGYCTRLALSKIKRSPPAERPQLRLKEVFSNVQLQLQVYKALRHSPF